MQYTFLLGLFIMAYDVTRTAKAATTINAYSTGSARTQASPAAEGAKKATISPTPASTAENPKAYQDAYDNVSGIVKNGADAKEVNKALDSIESLSQSDKRKLVDQLISEKKLDKLMNEVVDSSTFGGGVSRENRIDFFNDMAANLNGKQLKEIQQSLRKADKDAINARSNEEFSNAIAVFCTNEQVKIEYIKELSPTASNQKDFKNQDDSPKEKNLYDPEARSIAIVLSSFKKVENSDKALIEIQKSGNMESIINASVNPIHRYGASKSSSDGYIEYDVSCYNKITDLVSKSDSLRIKVDFLKVAGDFIPKSGCGPYIALGMEKIIKSDPVGVMYQLGTSDELNKGQTFSNFARVMIEKIPGGPEKLNDIITAFISAKPKDNSQKSWELFLNPQQNPELANRRAMVVGYMVGSISKAFTEINMDEAKKREYASAVFNDILGPLTSFLKVTGSNTSSVVLADSLFKDRADTSSEILNMFFGDKPDDGDIGKTLLIPAEIWGMIQTGVTSVK
jgi:hypothetical protein